jgi:hypothetical protein
MTGNLFVGLESGERRLRPTREIVGDDTVMYASDWPHWDNEYPKSLAEVRERPDLTNAQRGGVLSGSARRFYGPH